MKNIEDYSRKEQVRYCEERRKKYNMNPNLRFDIMNEEELKGWVTYYARIDKLHETGQAGIIYEKKGRED